MCGIALVLEALGSRTTPVSPGASFSSDRAACACYSSSPPADGLARALAPEIARRLRQRGPDHQAERHLATASGWALALHAAVLHLRGPRLVAQPVEDRAGNVLCWNGEVFGGLDGDRDADRARVLSESDTARLSEVLERVGRSLGADDATDPVMDVFRRLRGPFAVVYLHRATQRVYFAHDRFGRRSLLYAARSQGGDGGDGGEKNAVAELFARSEGVNAGEEDNSGGCSTAAFSKAGIAQLVLSSVAVSDAGGGALGFKEVPSTGVFVLDLRDRQAAASEDDSPAAEPVFRLEFHPYDRLPVDHATSAQDAAITNPLLVEDVYDCGLSLPPPAPPSLLSSAANALLTALSNAVGVRVRSIPVTEPGGVTPRAHVGVLFSGGLDSVVLAALTHFHLPPNEPVDLLTVCFDSASGFQSPDRLAAQLSHRELRRLFPTRAWHLVRVDVPYAQVVASEREVVTLMAPCETHMDFNIGAAFWFLARARGKLTEDAATVTDTTTATTTAGEASVDDLNAFLRPDAALSASYALDADVAALRLFGDDQGATEAAATEAVECPAANCKRKKKSRAACRFDVCRACCLRLQKLARKLLHFRADSSSMDPREAAKSVATLLAMGIQSHARVEELLDMLERCQGGEHDRESAACSCRAHRMKQARDAEDNEKAVEATGSRSQVDTTAVTPSRVYESPARVLLVGIGADEQLGGYGRHRTAFRVGGADGLRAELAKDLARIWKRNLGRDDRCISAHGREARFPFLDEQVVATIARLPLESVCDFALERGDGDKRVLRVAARQLGLESCTRLAKRAIQFGSRIAKHANARAFGSQRQAAGDAKFVAGLAEE